MLQFVGVFHSTFELVVQYTIVLPTVIPGKVRITYVITHVTLSPKHGRKMKNELLINCVTQ